MEEANQPRDAELGAPLRHRILHHFVARKSSLGANDIAQLTQFEGVNLVI